MQNVIGHYKIIELVGEGGLGKVFKAQDTTTGEIVALKLLHARYGNDERFLGVFHRELLMHRTLSHPGLVPVLDNHFEPPVCFIVSRFVDGWSLKGVIKHYGRLPPLVALSLLLQMSSGLDALHLRDLVHGDLSAANILVEKSGRAYLTDFSLTSDTTALAMRDNVFGTPGYYSPEHLQKTPVVPASDIYVMGLLLWEMVVGTKIIPALDASQGMQTLLQSMANVSFRNLQLPHAKLQAELLGLFRMMLHPLPSKRFDTGEKLGRAVDQVLRQFGIQNPQAAVVQFLADGLLPIPYKVPEQDIYLGARVYTIEDLLLFKGGAL